MDGQYYNLGDANNNTTSTNDNLVVKTIYDPCPAGYKLPPINVYTGFTTTGGNTGTASQFNVMEGVAWNKGWNFYCNSSKNTTVFFPASGFRNNGTAAPSYAGIFAYSWTAGPGSDVDVRTGYCISFGEDHAIPRRESYRGYGFSVRATQE